MTATDTTPRDPMALAETAHELSTEIITARSMLGQWAASMLPAHLARQRALACLRSAREGLDELIRELADHG